MSDREGIYDIQAYKGSVIDEANKPKVYHTRLVWTYDTKAKKGKWHIEPDPLAPSRDIEFKEVS